MAHLLKKAHVAPEHVAPNDWLTIDLDQRASTKAVCRDYKAVVELFSTFIASARIHGQ